MILMQNSPQIAQVSPRQVSADLGITRQLYLLRVRLHVNVVVQFRSQPQPIVLADLFSRCLQERYETLYHAAAVCIFLFPSEK